MKTEGYMQPYDGSGYGTSFTWEYRIRHYAKQNGETCPCWEDDKPAYLIEGANIKDVKFKIGCVKKLATCRTSFTETEKEMAEIFKRMYQ